jgi:hypothetical protein
MAIADGGLFDGVAGINWSIPAAFYLPKLRDQASDPHPTKMSSQSILHSAFEPTQKKSLQYVRDARGGIGNLNLEHTISFSELETLEAKNSGGNGLIAATKTFFNTNDPQERQRLAQLAYFDVYVDSQTGLTLAVPGALELSWNQEFQLLEARNGDGTLRLFFTFLQAGSFNGARNQLRSILSRFDRVITLPRPLAETIRYQHPIESYEYANGVFKGSHPATGAPSGIVVDITINEGTLTGTLVHSVGKLEDKAGVELALYNLMQVSEDFLSYPER